MDLKDKDAVVTGSAQGIGKAIALTLARNGADIAVCDIDEELAGQTAGEIEKTGSRALSCKLDVSQVSSVEEMLK